MKHMKRDLIIVALILVVVGVGYWYINLQKEAIKGNPGGAMAGGNPHAGMDIGEMGGMSGDTRAGMEQAKNQVRMGMIQEKREAALQEWIDKAAEGMEVTRSEDFGATDGVVATVNGEAISRESLDGRLAIRKMLWNHDKSGGSGSSFDDMDKEEKEKIMGEAVDELVQDAVIRQTDEGKKILAMGDELEGRVESMMQGLGTISDNANSVMEEMGLSEEMLRPFMREIVIRQIAQEQVAGEMTVTDEELNERMQEMLQGIQGGDHPPME